MRKCLACKDPLPPDAHWRRRYCVNNKCRSRAYRKREKKNEVERIRAIKKTVSTSAPVHPEDDGAFVVTCRCGHRLQIQVSHLEEKASMASECPVTAETVPTADSLSAVSLPKKDDAPENAPPLACEESAPQVAPVPPQEPPPPPLHAESSIIPSSEPAKSIRDGADALQTPPLIQTDEPLATASLSTLVVQESAPEPVFRTYELYAEQRGVPLLLDGALLFDGTRWRLRPGVRLKIGEQPEDGFGLAGSPGRWRDVYGNQSPTRFEHGERWAVMYMVESRRNRKGVGVPIEMLRELLGERWRELLGEAG